MIDLRSFDIADSAARDPATRSTELLLIAQLQPPLRAIVAAHPNSDAVVLEYLAQVGDTEVNETLARRAELAQTNDLWQQKMAQHNTEPPEDDTVAPQQVVVLPRPRLPRLSRARRLQVAFIGVLTLVVAGTGVVVYLEQSNPGAVVPVEVAPPPAQQLPPAVDPAPVLDPIQGLTTLCGGSSDYFSHVAASTKGTYFVTGSHQSNDQSYAAIPASDGILGLYSAEMVFKSVGTVGTTYMNVAAAPDGTVVAVGHIGSQAVVQKFDATGNPIWQASSFTAGQASFNNVTVAPDGSIYAIGQGDTKLMLTKLTTDGAVVWVHQYDSPDLFMANIAGLTTTADGSTYASGTVTLMGHTDNDATVIKFSKSGEFLWQKTYGGGGADSFGNIEPLSGGDLVVAGTTASRDGDFSDANGFIYGVVARLDPNGAIVWHRVLGGGASGSSWMYRLAVTPQDEIIAIGATDSFAGDFASWYGAVDRYLADGNPDMVVAALDSSGNYKGAKVYAGALPDNVLRDVTIDASGNIILVGQVQGPGGSIPPTCQLADAAIIKMIPAYPLA